jgi:hypothetical protein
MALAGRCADLGSWAAAFQPVCQPSLIEIVLPNSTSVRVDAQIDPRALRRVLSVLSKR